MNDIEASGQTPNDMHWLERAIERGVDAPTLEKLIDLKARMDDRLARQAFALAMNQCQQEMPRVIKDAENPHSKSRYVLLETLQDVIGPIYLRHGFSVSWSQGDAPAGLTRVVATLYHTGGHSERYQGDYPIDGEGAKGGRSMNALQGTVSAHTYAQRDMLRLMFSITIAGKDRDGAEAGLHPDLVTEINTAWDECVSTKAVGKDFDTWLHWVNPAAESLADLTELQGRNLLGELKRRLALKRKAGAK